MPKIFLKIKYSHQCFDAVDLATGRTVMLQQFLKVLLNI